MDTNRFYKITNPKDRQYTSLYINLDDISSVQYPNESLNVGIVITKTGKQHYVQKVELEKIIKLLNIIDTIPAQFCYTIMDNSAVLDSIYEPPKNYFPGK